MCRPVTRNRCYIMVQASRYWSSVIANRLSTSTPWITICARGAAAAAEPLWQAGCRRFFVLGAPHPDEQNTKRNGNGNGFGPRRLTAILQTLNRHGITIPPNQCIDCERTLEGGREAAWRLLDREFQTAPPTPECGILCLSDTDRDRRIARADGARHPHT